MSQMSLMPYFTQQFFDNNGEPLAGGKIYFYEPGTTTYKSIYSDSNGTVTLPNPVILDSAGRTQIFLDGYYKVVLHDANNTLIDTLDNVSAQHYQTSPFDQWITQSTAVTYISTTQFSLSGDKTYAYLIGRRIAATVTAGTLYGTISNSIATGNPSVTTVSVIWDTGELDNGLSSVGLGILTPTETALPILVTNDQVTNHTLTKTDFSKFVTLSGNSTTLTLGNASTFPDGFNFNFINLGANQATVVGTINGFTNVTFLQHEGAQIFNTGSNWHSLNLHNQDAVGTVKAWHKSLTGTPQTLPWGWVECNGQTISDAESPLNGQVVPNINGDGRFLRGSNVSGNTQANQFASHSHALNIVQTSAYMTVKRSGANLNIGYANANGSAQGLAVVSIDDGPDAVVFGNDTAWNFTGSTSGANGTGNETRPDAITMVYIMKIK